MKRFTIALPGLDDADIAMFVAALDAMPEQEWSLVRGNQAYLVVIDIDTVWGHMDWLRAMANDQQQVAAYTGSEQARGSQLLLHKPLDPEELYAVLAAATGNRAGSDAAAPVPAPEEPVPSSLAEAAPPTPATPEDPADSGQAEPEAAEEVATAEPVSIDEPISVDEPAPAGEPAAATKPVAESEPELSGTLGECLLAGKLMQPLTMQHADGTTLRLDPERGGYTGPATLKPLVPLLEMPIGQSRPLDADAIDHMRQAPAMPLTRLLWFAALSATPGELAPSLNPQARYHLSRWPQIEREFPRHFRIATAMMKQPGTLGDIASAANAPVSDVVDFVNAYSVAGYVSNDDAPTDATDTAAGAGMFSRLRRPFGRGGQKAP